MSHETATLDRPVTPTLTVLMGASGAGKTRWVTQHLDGRVLVSTEKLKTQHGTFDRAATAGYMIGLRRRAHNALAAGRNVVVDACNVRTSERSTWLNLAAQHRARTELVVVEATIEELLDAQHDREHPVAADRVRRYHADMQAARRVVEHEGWDSIAVVHRHGTTSTLRVTDDPAPRPAQWWQA